MQLELSNVVNISVSEAQAGVGAYNTSNLALFSDDAPQASTGTISFSAVAASGTFILNFAGHATSAINWNDTVSAIQAKINAVTGQANIILSGSIASKTLTMSQPGIFGAIPLPTVSSNSVEDSGSAAITITPVITNVGWSGGTLGYAQYVSPSQVALDFGTSSKTYAMANAVFSQQPNILAGGGQLVIIPLLVAQQTLTFSDVAASGAFEITYNGNHTTSLAWNATPAAIQAAVQLLPGCSQVQVTGSIGSEVLTLISFGIYGAGLAFGTTAVTLENSGSSAITVADASTVVGESIGPAVTRMKDIVQFFGVMVNEILSTVGQTDLLAAAAVIQPLNKIGFFVSNQTADISPGGMIDLLRTGSFTQTRGLYYGDTLAQNDLVMCASYAGLGLSVNFNGSNTTITMHLKGLIGVQPDPTMTQTILGLAQVSGADVYVSLQGVPKVFTSGANSFYDQVYNLGWLVGALQVAGFNFLAQSNTKVPQTESGMDGLKGAYRQVCEQAVTNQYCAPGSWNSSTTFGNQALFLQNITQLGYYIYSQPVVQQAQSARAARQAPLVQIALKQAGAIQESTVIVNVNA